MKVHVIKGIMTMGSHRFKSDLRVREPPGPQFAPPPATLEMLMEAIMAENFFSFTYFHGPSAARSHGWPLRMTNGKVSTDKHLYTHLLRSLFSTHHLSRGVDINSVAYAMNDTPHSVLKAYNQLMADAHRPIIADANRQALANGHKPLTPPNIPVIPKLKPTDPNQIPLI
jgi:hypothetical protein